MLFRSLSKLQPIAAADWARLAKPRVDETPSAPSDESGLSRQTDAAVADDPRAFLKAVMNDASVDMALRIEAARVLLAHG